MYPIYLVEVQQFVSKCFLFSFSVRNTKTETYISYTVKSGFGGERKFFFLTNGKTVGTSATRAADDLSYFPIQIDSRINKLIQQKEKPRALLFPNTHTNTSAVVCLCVCLTDRKRKQSITIGQCDHPHTQTNTHTHTHASRCKTWQSSRVIWGRLFPPLKLSITHGQ